MGMSGPGMQPHGGPIQKKALDGVGRVLVVASGKGGVGKSTIATNLAVSLQKLGHSVGLLDADIYGPSVPIMMNVSQRPMMDRESRKILPVMSYGVRCLSMGMLVDPEEAMQADSTPNKKLRAREKVSVDTFTCSEPDCHGNRYWMATRDHGSKLPRGAPHHSRASNVQWKTFRRMYPGRIGHILIDHSINSQGHLIVVHLQ